MNTYLVPIILYVFAIVFGVVWIWLCGGFEKYEVVFGSYKRREDSWAKFLDVHNAECRGPVIGEVISWNIETNDLRIYSGRGGTVRKGN